MRKYLLDTNVVIGYLDGQRPAHDLLEMHGATPAQSAVSVITRIELLGFRNLTPQSEGGINALISNMVVLPFDEAVEREATALRRQGRLKLPDAIIDGTARAHGLTFLMLDERLKAATENIT